MSCDLTYVWNGDGSADKTSTTEATGLGEVRGLDRLLTRQRFFLIRVIDLWNGLPQNVVDAKFKVRLDQHWNSLGYGYQQRLMA